MSNRFSRRYEIRRPVSGLIDQDFPEGARTSLKWILREYAEQNYYDCKNFREFLNVVLRACRVYENKMPSGVVPEIEHRATWMNAYVISRIDDWPWETCYDVVEVLLDLVKPNVRDQLHNALNEVLLSNYLAYEIRDGRIERAGTRIEDKVVTQARGLLRDPNLAGPNAQFLKAIGFYSRRPTPDDENCIKEAVGAVEGVARVLLADRSILLSGAIKQIAKEKGVHKTLQKMFENLYAFRGDAEGVAHGASGAGHQITLADAEFTLNAAGAMIVYLARLYGRAVE